MDHSLLRKQRLLTFILLPELLMHIFLLSTLLGCGEAPTSETPAPAPAAPADEAPADEAPAAEPAPSADADADADADAEAPGQDANHQWNLDADGVVMHGFDPVSYRAGEPVKGVTEHTHEWDGVTWHFASAENLATFKAAPEDYAPELGGYCTFGVVIEKKLDGDPKVYWVNDDKLYLFLNEEVRGKFAQDEPGNLAKTTENWPSLRDTDPQG